jgi:mono/diheme cytochrome c family protein
MNKTLTLILVSGAFIFLSCRAEADRPAGSGSGPEAAQAADKGIGPVKSLTLGPVDKALADKGKAIFDERCVACHSLSESKTGPAVGNVLAEVTPEFVMNLLLNTAEMAEKNPRIRGLLKKYGVPMPPPGLSQDQARAVVEYLRTTKK